MQYEEVLKIVMVNEHKPFLRNKGRRNYFAPAFFVPVI